MGNSIHTVIFDLDGTLSDSALLTMAAFRAVLPKQGLPMPSEEAVRRAMGYATPEFYYILFPDLPRDMVDNVGILVEEEELRCLPSLGGKLLFEGCWELLMRLKENGKRLCIASTGSRDHVLSTLDCIGITHFFDAVYCDLPDKTEMLRDMINNVDKNADSKSGYIDKNGYIMVGDMKKDYEAARTNGIVSVGACFGYCVREQTNFDFYIDKPLDLFKLII